MRFGVSLGKELYEYSKGGEVGYKLSLWNRHMEGKLSKSSGLTVLVVEVMVEIKVQDCLLPAFLLYLLT